MKKQMFTLLQCAVMNYCICGQKKMMTQPGFNLPVLANPLCAMCSLDHKGSVSLGSSLTVALLAVVSRGCLIFFLNSFFHLLWLAFRIAGPVTSITAGTSISL